LTITYLSQGKEEMYSIVSEDLDVETFEKCSLWKCYEALQQMAEENDR
jgi:hypothetical protein